MAAADLAIRIATTLDNTGIVRANKSVAKLQKSVKGLGVALGAAGVGLFAKQSLKAFVADQLAATRLANSVKNLGLEFANPYITDYISNLEKTSQVADDMLRPAFQRLLQQTGSLAKSQSILNTAIEVSRGTGESLSTVSEDLARAYYGQTRSLKKYSLSLTDAELKTKSFSELQDILSKKFSGSNAAYLNTYAGQLDILSLAWNNLQENAGKALFTLAGANGDQSSGARRLGGIVDAFGTGLVEAAKLFNNAFTAFGQAYFGVANAKPEVAPAPTKGQELFRKSSANDAKLKAIEKRQADLYKQQLAAQKALTAEQKKQAALKKAGSIFDMDQIQIVAALKGNLSNEERLRVEAMAALLNGNEVLATSLTKQILMAQDQSGKLYNYFLTIGDAKIKNPFEFLDKWVVEFQKKLDGLTAPKVSTYVPASIAPDIAALGVQAGYGAGTPMSIANQASNLEFPSYGIQTGGASTTQVIELKITGDGDLTNTIAKNLMNQSLSSGNQAYINRRTGGFE